MDSIPLRRFIDRARFEESRLDKIDRKYLGDAILVLVLLVITLGAFIKLENPSVLFAGSLAITFFVTANILMSS